MHADSQEICWTGWRALPTQCHASTTEPNIVFPIFHHAYAVLLTMLVAGRKRSQVDETEVYECCGHQSFIDTTITNSTSILNDHPMPWVDFHFIHAHILMSLKLLHPTLLSMSH